MGSTCGNLNQLGSDFVVSPNDDDLTIKLENLVIGNTYYLQVNKASNNQQLVFYVSQSFYSPQNITGNCEYVFNQYFEKNSGIVTNQNQLFLATPWDKGNLGTSDYFNKNYFNSGIVGPGYSVPNNSIGFQNSMPSIPVQDQGYAGFAGHFKAGTVNRHEYVQQRIKSPLVVGIKYHISFYVSLAENSSYACNKIGMYLSATKPYSGNAVLLKQTILGANVNPQIHSQQMPSLIGGIVDSKIAWTEISEDFVGNGEEWITIGNFTDMTNADGGVSYYYLDNVSITPVDFVINPQPISICPTASAPLTTSPLQLVKWNSTFGNFSCGVCNSTSINNLPLGNNTVTAEIILPVSMAGCIVQSSAIVNVTNTPTINVTANPTSIIPGGTSLLTAISPGATSYQWSPPSGLSSTTNAVTTFNLPITTTYNVSTNLGNGCIGQGTVTIKVVPPQCDKSMSIDYKSNGITTTSAVFNGLNVVNGANITISGTLNVDNNIVFQNCNFILDANAKIVISNSKKLSLQEKNHLYSCTNMWDGIYIDGASKGSLEISGNTLIEDAVNAVVSNNGGEYYLDHAIFNRNQQGLVVKNSNSISTPGIVSHSVFTSRVMINHALPSQYPDVDILKPTLPSLPSLHLMYPNDAAIGAYGIYADGVKMIEIGNLLLFDYQNLFDNLGTGIYLNLSNAIIKNNRFQNMVKSQNNKNCTSCPNLNYTGILANGNVNTGNYSIDISDFGTHLYEPNYFNEIYRSIDVKGYTNIHVGENFIANSNTISNLTSDGMGASGIYVQSPTSNNTIKIAKNVIENCYDAIKIDRNFAVSGNYSNVIISQNTISAAGLGQCVFGIKLADLSAAVQSGFLYANSESITENSVSNVYNCISADNVRWGLHITNNQAEIRYSSIASIQKRGIALSSCRDAIVDYNCYIVGLPLSTNYSNSLPNADIRGIYIFNSPGTRVLLNSIKNTSKALTFDGNCAATSSNKTKVQSNNLIQSYYGLYMKNNPNIGPQGNLTPMPNPFLFTNTPEISENKWMGNFNKKTITDNCALFDQNVFSKFYVRDDFLGINSETYPPNSTSGAFSPSLPYAQGSGFTLISGATEDWAFPGTNSCGLLKSPNNIDETTSDAPVLEETIENLEQINEAPEPLTDIEIAQNWEKQKFAYQELDNNQNLLQASDALTEFYNLLEMQPIGDFNYVEIALQYGYSLAKIINDGIVPTETIEINQKAINNLILKREENSDYIYNEIEYNEINSIAQQCIYTGGNAVLQARILLGTLLGNSVSFPDNCAAGLSRKGKANKEKSDQVNFFKISPNPSNGNLKLSYKILKGDKANFILYDCTGKELENVQLNAMENLLQLNEIKLSKGVYLYQIKVNEELVKSDKLILIN